MLSDMVPTVCRTLYQNTTSEYLAQAQQSPNGTSLVEYFLSLSAYNFYMLFNQSLKYQKITGVFHPIPEKSHDNM